MAKPGVYQARGVAIGHREVSANCAPITQVEMVLGRIWENGAWVKLANQESFVGEWFLYKASGEPSDHRWKMMQEVLGWDGEDLESLQNTDISKRYFNVTIDVNEKDPKYVEATFLNPLGDPVGKKKTLEKAPVALLRRFSVRKAPPAPPVGDLEDLGIQEDNVPF